MDMSEEFLGRERIFDGAVLHVCRDTVRLPNGATAVREHILHVGAVAILPLTDDGEVILERQYRYPFATHLLEIPAGKLNDAAEDPLEAAKRELREETGATAREWIGLGEFYGSPAILGEHLRLFFARGLTFGPRQLDDDEFLEVVRMPLDELIELISRGCVPDGKTQVCAYRVADYLRKEKRKK